MPCPVFAPRLLSVLIAASLLPIGASANEAQLPTIEVVDSLEKAAPFAAGVENAPALRATTSDTASLLRDVPGVSLYGSGGVSSLPAIHGLADDRLRIKVGGMDLIAACPNHMNPALSYLDPSQVESIGVYAGIAPVSVGGDSIGGAIVAKTADPEFARPGEGSLVKGKVGTYYRSNGNAKGANAAATYATEGFNISYTGAIAQSDNYDAGGNFKDRLFVAGTPAGFTGHPGHTLPADEVGSTAYDTRNHTLGLAFRGGSHLFEAKFGYQDMPEQLWPNQRMDLLANEQKRVNLRYAGDRDWASWRRASTMRMSITSWTSAPTRSTGIRQEPPRMPALPAAAPAQAAPPACRGHHEQEHRRRRQGRYRPDAAGSAARRRRIPALPARRLVARLRRGHVAQRLPQRQRRRARPRGAVR